MKPVQRAPAAPYGSVWSDPPRRSFFPALPFTLWRRLTLSALWPFLLLLAVLSTVLLLLLLLRLGEIAPAAAFSLSELLPLFAYGLPHLCLFTLPVAWLAALLLTFGQLSADGGYLAARAAGIGPWRLALPLFGVGVLLSAGALYLSIEGEHWGNQRLRREVLRLAKVGVVAGLRPGVFNDAMNDVTFYVGDTKEGGALSEILLYDRRDPARPLLVVAHSGRIVADPNHDRLRFSLAGGELHALDDGGRTFRRATFERYTFELDLGEFLSKRVAFLGTFEELPLAEMARVIDIVRSEGKETWRYELHYQRKFALPAAPLLFALLGFGLGLGRVRAPRIRATLLAVLLIALYYALQRSGDMLASSQRIDVVWCAWLPIVVLAPVGAVLAWRTTRGLR